MRKSLKIERFLCEEDRAILTCGAGTYSLYAVKVFQGKVERAYYRVDYNHSTKPTFHTVIIDGEGTGFVRSYNHPKRVGVTRVNGWSVDPEELHAEW